MSYLDWLLQFLFSPGSVDLADYADLGVAVFANSAAVIGLVVVTVDFFLVKIKAGSGKLTGGRGGLLKIPYASFPYSLWYWVLWGGGAGLGAFLAAIADISQLSVQSALAVGLSWPAILPRLVKTFESEPPAEQPVPPAEE